MRSTSLPARGASFGLLTALLLGLTLLLSPVAGAQSTPVPGTETIRTISVSGFGTVKIDPDTAQLDLGVVSNNESLEVAQTEVSEGLAAITAVLTDAGILREDIATTSYNVYPIAEYDRDGNYVGIERYEVSSGLAIVVRDIDSVGTVLDAAVEAGANNVWGISFYVEDPSSAATQARSLAVEDARTKADELATASGMVVTNVVSISETSAPPPMPVDFDLGRGGADMVASEQASVVPVSPGQSEVRVDLQITFEIEQAAG
ncbi:MAG: SIMPL domain-containing protein [Chloroflexota bacterium]|nr:SIMPL domain-containing protein [Chloroflexota bacterium]